MVTAYDAETTKVAVLTRVLRVVVVHDDGLEAFAAVTLIAMVRVNRPVKSSSSCERGAPMRARAVMKVKLRALVHKMLANDVRALVCVAAAPVNRRPMRERACHAHTICGSCRRRAHILVLVAHR